MFLQVCVILFTGGSTLPGTPPRTQCTPQTRCTPLPQTTYTPGTRNPPGTRYTTPPPPRTRYIYTPLGPSTPPLVPGIPPRTRYTPRCRVCWEIRSTRGRYASYWNAVLFKILLQLQWQLPQLTSGILTTLSRMGAPFIADDIIKIQIWHRRLV